MVSRYKQDNIMSRIEAKFKKLAGKRAALITFVTAGDPNPEATLPLMHSMVKAGADVIELGVPFSDPMAEGPVIQAACERALLHHINLPQIFEIVRQFRETDQETPVILMGYLNPLEVMGYAEFAKQASAAGVDGVLTVDIPPEEAAEYCEDMHAQNVDTVFLVAPTSTDERIKAICEKSRGFVYYVSLKGVTGSKNLDIVSVKDKLNQIEQFSTIPVGVGFGIKDADSAAQVAAVADAVVVGSAIVKLVGANAGDNTKMQKDVTDLIKSMRTAIDQTGKV